MIFSIYLSIQCIYVCIHSLTDLFFIFIFLILFYLFLHFLFFMLVRKRIVTIRVRWYGDRYFSNMDYLLFNTELIISQTMDTSFCDTETFFRNKKLGSFYDSEILFLRNWRKIHSITTFIIFVSQKQDIFLILKMTKGRTPLIRAPIGFHAKVRVLKLDLKVERQYF